MLVNYSRRIALFTPFKNFSTTLHDYMGRNRQWALCIGPQPFDGLIGTHCNVTATWWTDWELWLPIRNPFERVTSMWKYCCREGGFIPFSRWVGERIHEPHFGPVTALYPYTRLLRCERMESVLSELGCDYGKLPKLNASGRCDPQMTPSDRRMIERVHSADFQLGGY